LFPATANAMIMRRVTYSCIDKFYEVIAA